MPEITVNGATLVYEILGQGPPVVFTPGGLWGIENARPLAKRLSSRYRVLIYDPRNCGASGVVIERSQSEWELWVDDLHALLDRLGMSPAYVGGGSRGEVLSVMLAHRHPEDVRGLFLIAPPTDNPEVWQWIADNRYGQPADLSESRGMQAVIETSVNWEASMADWEWGKRIEQNPANRDRLLSMDPEEFAAVMRQWSTWTTSSRAHFGGLTDDELRHITTPAIIVPGLDETHPQHTAEELHRLLPHSELVVHSESFSLGEIAQLQRWVDQDEGEKFDAACAPILDDFMQRIDAERSAAS